MLVATPDVGPWSFYLEDPARGVAWESFLIERFVPHLRSHFQVADGAAIAMLGISMGGYGALKLAFSYPQLFGSAAVLSPMLEPAMEAADVSPRNRYHYPPEVPQALLGTERDPVLYRTDHPARRALANHTALRERAPALYIDAAGRDLFHAHDGAELLHRVLWELDVRHEYRLRMDADHVGPDFIERLQDAWQWLGQHLCPRNATPLTAAEEHWETWLAGDRQPPAPTPLPPTSRLFPRVLRATLSSRLEAAATADPSVQRSYGKLPAFSVP
jgi:S-formylglutathione hydrolase